jgi:hypothetical protein
VLAVTGTDRADRIHLRESAGSITLDGFTGSIPSSAIKRIVVDARGGDDAVALDLTAGVAARASVQGGAGRDSLLCGSRARPGGYAGFESYLDTSLYGSERWGVDAAFANLRGEFEVQSPSTSRYNCIAWSLGITSQWINPKKTLAEFDQLNGQYGYRRMSTLDFSRAFGYEKIVLYGKKDAFGRVTEYTHQARQLPDGTWTSKLGGMAQVRHVTPDTLNGSAYGVPVAVYYRFNPNFF